MRIFKDVAETEAYLQALRELHGIIYKNL